MKFKLSAIEVNHKNYVCIVDLIKWLELYREILRAKGSSNASLTVTYIIEALQKALDREEDEG